MHFNWCESGKEFLLLSPDNFSLFNYRVYEEILTGAQKYVMEFLSLKGIRLILPGLLNKFE